MVSEPKKKVERETDAYMDDKIWLLNKLLGIFPVKPLSNNQLNKGVKEKNCYNEGELYELLYLRGITYTEFKLLRLPRQGGIGPVKLFLLRSLKFGGNTTKNKMGSVANQF